MGGGGGGMGSLIFGLLPLLFGRKLGCGTLLILAVVGYFLFSSGMLNLGGSGMAPTETAQQGTGGNQACDTQEELFACRVLKSTEDTWGALFAQAGQRYQPTTLNFYQQGTQSGCGSALLSSPSWTSR